MRASSRWWTTRPRWSASCWAGESARAPPVAQYRGIPLAGRIRLDFLPRSPDIPVNRTMNGIDPAMTDTPARASTATPQAPTDAKAPERGPVDQEAAVPADSALSEPRTADALAAFAQEAATLK